MMTRGLELSDSLDRLVMIYWDTKTLSCGQSIDGDTWQSEVIMGVKALKDKQANLGS